MEWPVKLEDVLEWLRSSPINQAIVIGGVVLLLLVVILLIRSRRARHKAPVARGALGRLDGRTQEVLELYRESHPAFYRIVEEYRQHQMLDQLLLTDPDFAAAFEKLKKLKSKAERQTRDKRVSALQISAAGDRESVNKETRAAMLTILRVLYLNRDAGTAVTPQADADLDRLLESLTD